MELVHAGPLSWLGTAADPYRFGLDMVIPAFFTAMLVSLWQGPRKSIGWVIGGVVAILADITMAAFGTSRSAGSPAPLQAD